MADAATSVLVVVGTRPEVIKLAPVLRELDRRPDRFSTTVCATGQHRDLLDRAMSDFDITPDADLDVMQPDQDLAALTARLVTGLDAIIGRHQPSIVLVQGDTTSAWCGALAAYYRQATVGHVEAGLRTGDLRAPFPEEGNRRMIAALADVHFAPTRGAAEALVADGVDPATVFTTGNTVVDALCWMRDRIRASPPKTVADLDAGLGGRRVVLMTAHRREHFGPDLEAVCAAVLDIVERDRSVEVVVPVHPNPSVRRPVSRLLGHHARIHLLDPLGYPEFVWLMGRAAVILTDSGGVQEEAPSLGTPVLVTRHVTERPEGVDAGHSLIVGPDRARIAEETARLLARSDGEQILDLDQNPYGDGRAAVRIVDALEATR